MTVQRLATVCVLLLAGDRCVPTTLSEWEPAVPVSITERDEEILETLSTTVRVFSLAQLAYHWWAASKTPVKQARDRLRELRGYIEIEQRSAYPILPLLEPEAAWSPGCETPDFWAVAYRLRKRWVEPLQITTVCKASRRTANRFGGSAGWKHAFQLSHDLHQAELYLRRLKHDPSIRDRWVGEDMMTKEPNEKRPDAVLVDEHGRPTLVIEFGGMYQRRRLQAFHRFCEKRKLPYELW